MDVEGVQSEVVITAFSCMNCIGTEIVNNDAFFGRSTVHMLKVMEGEIIENVNYTNIHEDIESKKVRSVLW